MLLLQNKPKLAFPHLYDGYRFSWHNDPSNQMPENAAQTTLYLVQALLDIDSTQKAKIHIDRSIQLFSNRA
ncbi:hypothetical protein GCM10028807_09770 [Spirosoma daeguense]